MFKKPLDKRLLSLFANTVLVLLSLAIGVALVEVALRMFVTEDALVGSAEHTYDDVAINALVSPPSPREREAFRWGGNGDKVLHQKSADRRLVYELRPNVRINEMIYTNADGFRDGPFSKEKGPDVRRIAVVGDSITFGWYEMLESTYPKILESLLNDYCDGGTHYEVYNMAVGGYNADQELQLIRTRVPDYKPDMVVLQYSVTDSVVDMDAGLYVHFTRSKFQVVNLLNRIWKLWIQFGPVKDLVERSYPKLAAWSKETGIPVLVVIFPAMSCSHPSVWNEHMRVAREAGLTCLSLEPAFTSISEGQVYDDCWHPNEFGHRVAAEEIFNWLIKDSPWRTVKEIPSAVPDFLAARADLVAGFECLRRGDYQGLESFYRESILHAPVYAQYASYSCVHAARRLCGESKYDEALHLARLAAEWSPEDPQALLEISRSLKHVGTRDEAIQAYRHFITTKGTLPPAGKNDIELAEAWEEVGNLLAQEDPKEALSAWDNSIRSAPWFSKAYDAFEGAYLAKGDGAGLIVRYKDFLQEKPEEEVLFQRLTKVLLQAGDAEQAGSYLTRALELYPDSYPLRQIREDWWAATGNKVDAGKAYREALDADPESPLYADRLSALLSDAELLDFWSAFVKSHPNAALPRLYLGKALERTAKPEAARNAYAELLRDKPDNADALYRLGVLNLESANLQEGLSQLRRAVALAPQLNCPAAHQLGEIATPYKEAGKLAEAAPLYSLAIELCPADLWNQVALGEVRRAEGDTAAATEVYSSVLTADPDFPGVARMLDDLLTSAGDVDKAASFWGTLAETHPNSGVPYFYLGTTLEQKGRPDEARVQYDKALERYPKFTEAMCRLGMLELLAGEEVAGRGKLQEALQIEPAISETLAQQISARVEELSRSKEHDKVIALCATAMELGFGDADIRTRLAQAYEDKGDPDKAEALYSAVLSEQPGAIMAAQGMERLFVASHDDEKACAFWRELVRLHPGSFVPSFYLAAALARSGAVAEAKSAFLKALTLDPTSPVAMYHAGILQVVTGEVDEGKEQIKNALALDPSLGNAITQKVNETAARLLETNDPASAGALYEATSALTPPDLWGQAAMGRIAEAKGEPAAAAILYGEIVKQDPAFPLTDSQKTVLFRALETSQQDEDYWNSLVSLHPDSAPARFYLGLNLEEKHKNEDAAKAYEKALELSPDFGEARYRLGALEIVQGNLTAGLEKIREAAGRNPGLAGEISLRLAGIADDLAARNDFEPAITLYKAALEFSPQDLWPQVHLGNIYETQGNVQDALNVYRAILTQKPESPVTARNLQRVLANMQAAPDVTVAEWRALTGQHPESAVLLHYLGKALEAAGDGDAAREAFKRSREINPNIDAVTADTGN